MIVACVRHSFQLYKFEEWLANRRTRSFRFSPTSKARSHALYHQWPITFFHISSSHGLRHEHATLFGRFMHDCVTDNVTGLNQVDERAKRIVYFFLLLVPSRSHCASTVLSNWFPFLYFLPTKKCVVSLHSHCDTRYTSKISNMRFLAKIQEADKREEKREIISKQYCLLELVRWTGLWLWSAYELQVRTHIQTKRSIRSRGIRRGCWWYSQTEETVAVDEPI